MKKWMTTALMALLVSIGQPCLMAEPLESSEAQEIQSAEEEQEIADTEEENESDVDLTEENYGYVEAPFEYTYVETVERAVTRSLLNSKSVV